MVANLKIGADQAMNVLEVNERFFATKLQSKKVYPIYEYYNEETLFTVIEILYDHIGYYDYELQELITKEPQEEFCEHINNILKLYKDGFYLEPQNGYIMEMPNAALKEQLAYEGKEMGDDAILYQYNYSFLPIEE